MRQGYPIFSLLFNIILEVLGGGGGGKAQIGKDKNQTLFANVTNESA